MTCESATSGRGGAKAPRLLDQVKETMHRKYMSRRTEEAYTHCIRRYIYFTGKRHPATLGEAEVVAFLSQRVHHNDLHPRAEQRR
jgi:hypothetical protein